MRAAGPGRRGKFNANGEHVDGQWCASAAEAERFRQLKRMAEAGRIGGLQCQVTYPLIVNNQLITRYRADFTYDVLDSDGEPTRTVIEDVKGMVTPEFTIKAKLFAALILIPLTVIAVKGKARHPTIEPTRGTSQGWMHQHWNDKIPD